MDLQTQQRIFVKRDSTEVPVSQISSTTKVFLLTSGSADAKIFVQSSTPGLTCHKTHFGSLSEMKRIQLFGILALSILAVGGCSSRDPILYKGQAYDRTEIEVKNAIVMAALTNDWSICQAGNNQLRADITYKKWKIYADISYSKDWFSITPNLEYTTLASKKYGTVHRNVNNLIKRFYKSTRSNLALSISQDPIDIPRCAVLPSSSQNSAI